MTILHAFGFCIAFIVLFDSIEPYIISFLLKIFFSFSCCFFSFLYQFILILQLNKTELSNFKDTMQERTRDNKMYFFCHLLILYLWSFLNTLLVRSQLFTEKLTDKTFKGPFDGVWCVLIEAHRNSSCGATDRTASVPIPAVWCETISAAIDNHLFK